MIVQIKLFLFILSCIYSFRYIIEFFIKILQENPEQMEIEKTNQVFLYFSSAYIITYFLI